MLPWKRTGGGHVARDSWDGLIGDAGRASREPALDEARRLWQNGRYAEALEAYDALDKATGEARPGRPGQGRPGPGRLPGEPGRIRQGRRGARQELAGDQPDNADLPRPPGRPEVRAAATGTAPTRPSPRRSRSTPTTSPPAGSRPGCWRHRARSTRRSKPGSGSSTATTPTAAEIAKDADALLIVGQAAERYYRARGPGRGAERLAQRRDQRDLRGGAQGRPALLAGPLARRPAVPRGLRRVEGACPS